MTKIILNSPGISAFCREVVAATMAKHDGHARHDQEAFSSPSLSTIREKLTEAHGPPRSERKT